MERAILSCIHEASSEMMYVGNTGTVIFCRGYLYRAESFHLGRTSVFGVETSVHLRTLAQEVRFTEKGE